MFFRYGVSLFLAAALFLPGAPAAAEPRTVDLEAGPIWSNDHARERCPEVARQWTDENPGFRAEWTGQWTTTVPGEMSVCGCEIVSEDSRPPTPVEVEEVIEVGGDLRTRRGYRHAWINEAENVSVLYFLFDNGVLQLYHDEPGMGHVFRLDLSGLPEVEDMADKIAFEDIDGDGYADLKVPLPGGAFASWRWDVDYGTFEAAAGAELLPVSAETRKTLAALPAWEASRMVVHVGELAEIASRVGYSWLLDCALDIRPERKGVLEWLRSFPVESFSLVRGLSDDESDVFHGALRFTDDKADILSRLEELSPLDEDASGEVRYELVALFHQLAGVPYSLVGEDGIRIHADFVDDERNLYALNIASRLFEQWQSLDDVYVSVAGGGNEKLLLAASSPEEIARMKSALDGESARLEIVRRDSGKANFLQIADDASGSETREMLSGMYLTIEPKAPGGLELSLGLSDSGFEMSFWQSLASVFLGDAFSPRGDWRAEDAGFGFGGGSPWLAGSFSPGLSEKNILDLLVLFSHGNEELVREMLKQTNIDPATLSGAFRSFGLVLGGNASLDDKPMPGGYVFASGDAEKMRALMPVLKMVLDSRLSHSFEAVDREGWDVFYALNDDYRERSAGMPWHVGVRNGVLMMGVVGEDDLESEPDIEWPEDGDDRSLLLAGSLDFPVLVEQSKEFLETIPLHKAYDAALALDMENLFEQEAWAAAFKFFAAMQEVGLVTLTMPDVNRLELKVRTESVDYEQVWDLMRTSRILSNDN